MEKLTIEEIKKQTLKLLGSSDENDVAYITEELVNMDGTEIQVDDNKEGKAFRSYYGHTMRYGSRNGQATYEFLSNPQWAGDVCASRNAYWFYQSRVHHSSAGFNCRVNNNNTAVIRFDPR